MAAGNPHVPDEAQQIVAILRPCGRPTLGLGAIGVIMPELNEHRVARHHVGQQRLPSSFAKEGAGGAAAHRMVEHPHVRCQAALQHLAPAGLRIAIGCVGGGRRITGDQDGVARPRGLRGQGRQQGREGDDGFPGNPHAAIFSTDEGYCKFTYMPPSTSSAAPVT